jgi:hypothetical protein
LLEYGKRLWTVNSGGLMVAAPPCFFVLFVAFCEFQLPFQGQTQTAGRLMILSYLRADIADENRIMERQNPELLT